LRNFPLPSLSAQFANSKNRRISSSYRLIRTAANFLLTIHPSRVFYR
jgi:hypothetical protein